MSSGSVQDNSSLWAWELKALEKLGHGVVAEALTDQSVAAGWVIRRSATAITPRAGTPRARGHLKSLPGRLANDELVRIAHQVCTQQIEEEEVAALGRIVELLYKGDPTLPELLRNPEVIGDLEDAAAGDLMDPMAGTLALAIAIKQEIFSRAAAGIPWRQRASKICWTGAERH